MDRFPLANTIHATDRLLLHVRIPKQIQNNHLGGRGEIQPQITRLERYQQNHGVQVARKIPDCGMTIGQFHTAVVSAVGSASASKRGFHQIQEGGKLTGDEDLLSFSTHLDGLHNLQSFVNIQAANPLLPKSFSVCTLHHRVDQCISPYSCRSVPKAVVHPAWGQIILLHGSHQLLVPGNKICQHTTGIATIFADVPLDLIS